jgi:hypothetical protein
MYNELLDLPVIQQRPVMHVLVCVIQPTSQAGTQQLARLSRPPEEQLGSSSQQRQLDLRRLTAKGLCQGLQQVRGGCRVDSETAAAAAAAAAKESLGHLW